MRSLVNSRIVKLANYIFGTIAVVEVLFNSKRERSQQEFFCISEKIC